MEHSDFQLESKMILLLLLLIIIQGFIMMSTWNFLIDAGYIHTRYMNYWHALVLSIAVRILVGY